MTNTCTHSNGTYYAGASILTGVWITLDCLPFAVVSFVAIHALAEVLTKSIVDTCGVILTGHLALTRIQICEMEKQSLQQVKYR